MEHMFFLRFLISSLIVSGLTLVIIAVKKIGNKHISVKWQYNIWMIFMVMLIIPFLPQELFSLADVKGWGMGAAFLQENSGNTIQALNQVGTQVLDHDKEIQDLALSVNPSMVDTLNQVLGKVWVIGMIGYAGMIILGQHKLYKIRKSMTFLDKEEVYELFEGCKARLNIKKAIILSQSHLVDTPIAFGAFKTYIVLPAKTIEQLSLEDLKYILLHELAHYKNKDIVMNYVMCFFQMIHWFNPLVYLGFKKMRTDREIACDNRVLKLLDKRHYIQYGRTIINFAEIVSSVVPLHMTTSIGGSKTQIKTRIEKIAEFKRETKIMKLKSLMIFGLIGTVIFSQAPLMSVMAYENNSYAMEEKQVTYEDLSAYFKGFEGSFVLYDLEADQYSIYNKAQSMKRVSPNSTYKIYSGLIGLEEGIIRAQDSALKWDGEIYPFEAWNQDQDLDSAMGQSVNWYFQSLDKAVGVEKLQYYFDKIGYGNRNLSGGVSNYWMESSLAISPVEQVELLKAFYTEELMFKKEHIDFIKETLRLSRKGEAVLSGKTGTGMVEGKSINGWFIGYVEREGKTFFFATQIQGKDDAKGNVAKEITLSILKDKDIY
nr:BlaR1 family beta-lactam sensor/signal transducer [uncultured Niameybacter sp.]